MDCDGNHVDKTTNISTKTCLDKIAPHALTHALVRPTHELYAHDKHPLLCRWCYLAPLRTSAEITTKVRALQPRAQSEELAFENKA